MSDAENTVSLSDHEVRVLLHCKHGGNDGDLTSIPIDTRADKISQETVTAISKLVDLGLVQPARADYWRSHHATEAGKQWLRQWAWWSNWDFEPAENPAVAVVEAVGSIMSRAYEETCRDYTSIDIDYPEDLDITRWPEGGGSTEFNPGPWARQTAGYVEAIIEREVERRLAERTAA